MSKPSTRARRGRASASAQLVRPPAPWAHAVPRRPPATTPAKSAPPKTYHETRRVSPLPFESGANGSVIAPAGSQTRLLAQERRPPAPSSSPLQGHDTQIGIEQIGVCRLLADPVQSAASDGRPSMLTAGPTTSSFESTQRLWRSPARPQWATDRAPSANSCADPSACTHPQEPSLCCELRCKLAAACGPFGDCGAGPI